jgi:hypothetical protein
MYNSKLSVSLLSQAVPRFAGEKSNCGESWSAFRGNLADWSELFTSLGPNIKRIQNVNFKSKELLSTNMDKQNTRGFC